jgi:peptidoglycan/LPS O-acetylase OafA/YrhL
MYRPKYCCSGAEEDRMLIGLLLPLLHRVGARIRMLIAVAVVVAGLALVLAMVLQGHAPGKSVLLIRVGLLLALGGSGLFASGVRGNRRDRRTQGDGTGQPDGNAGKPDEKP